MREISREESRQIMIDILDDVTSFCDAHSIVYFLSSGTLLGAIRHKGFIPWDDDIDIEMPRPDYEKFVALYKKHGKFSLSCPTDKDSFLFHTKVYDARTIKYEHFVDYKRYKPLGVDIDIFVIDGQPDESHYDEFKRITYQNIKLLNCLVCSVSPYIGNIRKRLIIFICRIIGKEYFKKRYMHNSHLYSYERSSFVAPAGVFSGLKSRHRKCVYSDKIAVTFEGKRYWAPVGYDEYLRDLFGDYMNLPPIEERITHHINKIFWK